MARKASVGRRYLSTAIALSPELVRRLDALARATRRSRSFVVRDLVERGFDRLEHSQAAAR